MHHKKVWLIPALVGRVSVERLLASGVKAEQVGFYRDFSKAELQKCIQAYPEKEVCYLIYIVHVYTCL